MASSAIKDRFSNSPNYDGAIVNADGGGWLMTVMSGARVEL